MSEAASNWLTERPKTPIEAPLLRYSGGLKLCTHCDKMQPFLNGVEVRAGRWACAKCYKAVVKGGRR